MSGWKRWLHGISAVAVMTAAGFASGSAQEMMPSPPPGPVPLPQVLQNYSPVTADRLRKPEDSNWLLFRRTYDGWGYSPLAQITPENAGRLQLKGLPSPVHAQRVRPGEPSRTEVSPSTWPRATT